MSGTMCIICGFDVPNDEESRRLHNKSKYHKERMFNQIQKDIDIFKSVDNVGRMEYTEHDIKLTIDGKPFKVDVFKKTVIKALFEYQKTIGIANMVEQRIIDDAISGFHRDDLNE
ncbi:hypothetical protein [Ferroplasma acidiphilum]|uniref:hypothetical protein n=1 Tax=Ferroplasma acidiphilum TaxID=74969 RepID=UPI0028165F65|nr:hypothetical protein [Ferroplasma acidiphilum]WMT54119.1 MAG: hypothetical protein RE473_04520 [Ferroplasma acidiphilum]